MLDWIGLFLAILGLFGASGIVVFKDRLVLWWYATRGNEESLRKHLHGVISRRASPFPAIQNVGTYSEVKAGWFVDFLSAVIDLDDRRTLERCMTRWIFISLESIGRDAKRVNRIAVPKLGNVLLADVVARRFRRPLLIVRQEPAQYVLPGQVFEGAHRPGEKVILIDDISSDAEFLVRCVRQLRAANLDILAVLTLVDRKEGECRARLSELKVSFAPLLSMSDADIEECRAKHA